jgi:hypothetical protein
LQKVAVVCVVFLALQVQAGAQVRDDGSLAFNWLIVHVVGTSFRLMGR